MSTDIITILEKAGSLSSRRPFFEECDTILIYGAGNIGRDVLRAMRSRAIKAAGFLDRKAATGEQCNSLPVYPPEWNGLTIARRQQTSVVVAVHNGDAEIPPVIEYLRDRGYGRIVNLVEFYDHFSEEMGDRFCLTSRSSYKIWEKAISEGYDTWEDQHSRQLYLRLLNFRLTGDYADLPLTDADNQYFPAGIPAWKTPLRFVDGGAFDGDTIRSALHSQYSIESATAFEPDLANFRKLVEYVSSVGNSQIYLWPCGIFSSTTRLNFADGALESSKLDQSGNATVQTVALDDVIPSFKPNLIKFDIEGAEYDGLLGAKRIIHDNRPGLAICLYHRPQDMWQIPLLVKSWDLGYRFFMRLHKNNGFDLVMYAIPAESLDGSR